MIVLTDANMFGQPAVGPSPSDARMAAAGFRLPPSSGAAANPPPATPQCPDNSCKDPMKCRRWWPWTLFGSAIGGMAVTMAVLMYEKK